MPVREIASEVEIDARPQVFSLAKSPPAAVKQLAQAVAGRRRTGKNTGCGG
jgi:hypothetical protein